MSNALTPTAQRLEVTRDAYNVAVKTRDAEIESLRAALEELETAIERKWGGSETEKRRANALSPRIEEALEAARKALDKGGTCFDVRLLDGVNGL